MDKLKGVVPRIGRWIFIAAAVVSGEVCGSDAFLSMPLVGDVLTPQTAARQYQNDVVRLAISHFSYPNVNYDIIYPTIRSLEQAFGENRLYVEIVSGEDVDTSRFDLVLGSAGTYRRFTHRGTRDIASLVSDRFPDPNRAEGSVFAVMKTNPASRLEELRGSRLISTGLQAFSGYHIAMGELLDHGVKPATFFSETVEVEHNMLSALSALREGRGDVAVFRTCFLEDLQAAGFDVSDIRVVNERVKPGFACRTSTELYPNWTFFITPHAQPQIARQAASALLSLAPGANGLHWTIATDFTPVDELFRRLQVGPYEYLQRWSLTDFLRRYWEWFVFLAAGLLGLIAHSIRTDRLVTLRTQQLKDAWAREKALQARAEAASQYLAVIRRRSLIGQMSSMIAHELRQPLAAIVNYAQGMLRLLDKGDGSPRDEMLMTGMAVIRGEAQKADGIVGKVRAYARHQEAEADRCEVNLSAVTQKAVTALTALNRWTTPVDVAPGGDILLWGDPLEIEVAVVNLIKNALEAAEGVPGGRVTVSLTEVETQGGTEALLAVTNPAPNLTDEAFDRLNRFTESSKADGLGLGLSIVRGIADSHAGRLIFVRTASRRVRAEFRLPVKRPTAWS